MALAKFMGSMGNCCDRGGSPVFRHVVRAWDPIVGSLVENGNSNVAWQVTGGLARKDRGKSSRHFGKAPPFSREPFTYSADSMAGSCVGSIARPPSVSR